MKTALLDAAKIVIWDLDGTFWTGVLGEEGAQFRTDMLEVVRDLNRHGIISSIASHNDFAGAKAFLELHAAWEHFVFPIIDWESKADMIRAILSDTQLRPENAILLDDAHRWRELVAGEHPTLLAACAADEFLAAYRAWSTDRPFSDPALQRLHDYKLLERKQVVRKSYPPTHEATLEFLRKSAIRCTITPVSAELVARIEELVLRTNQLNFTRNRATGAELEHLLNSNAYECRAVHVTDRFGDYGVCGFYALATGPQPRLVHFLFSCRILHMGVEAAIYARLGTPVIESSSAAPSARLTLDAATTDWVVITEQDRHSAPARTVAASQRARPQLALIGPCELETIGGTIRALCGEYIDTELRVNFVNDLSHVIRHHGHHAFLDLAGRPLLSSRYAATLSRLPWFDRKLLEMNLDDAAAPDVVVMSAVRNAQCADYRHKSGDFTVPLDYFRPGGLDFTKPENFEIGRGFISWYHGDPDPNFMEWFADQFAFEGPIPGAAYGETLEALLGRLPARTRLIMINVTNMTVLSPASPTDVDPALVATCKEQHDAINAAILSLNQRHPLRTAVIDVNRHIRSADDCCVQAQDERPLPWASSYWFFERYYHFRRQVYVGMVFDLLDILIRWGAVEIDRETREGLEDMLSERWWEGRGEAR